MFDSFHREESLDAIEAMQRKRNLLNLKPFDLVQTWERCELRWCCENFVNQYPEFYLLYEHPVHHWKNKLFRISRDECLEFLNEYIKPDEGTGVDITIASLDLKKMILCNHDGDLFLVTL